MRCFIYIYIQLFMVVIAGFRVVNINEKAGTSLLTNIRTKRQEQAPALQTP